MKKKILLLLIMFNSFTYAQNNKIEIDLNKKISETELNKFIDIYRYQNKSAALSALERRTIFAKTYLTEYGLSNEDLDLIKIVIKNMLSKKYIDKLLEKNKPTDIEAKSYYKIHKKEFGNKKFEEVKNIIKKRMVQLNRYKIVKKEYERLKYEK